ncbi:MAG: FAD-binding oxidoreductase [Alphaproteobacteria bacterium]|nr:FAD-binding oxidoreductase [Alphaproteobacteria bacterium]
MPPSLKDAPASPNPPFPLTPDLAIIGGGIVGLWCARYAADLGLSTVLIEKGGIGQGASGGFLGALMPHQPIAWSPVKAFQLDALLSLETEIAQLQNQTGMSCGYLRCGRLIPTRTEKKRKQRETWQAAAIENWPARTAAGLALEWRLLEATPDPTWLLPGAAPLGCEFDTLSARLHPRKTIAALRRSLQQQVYLRENSLVERFEDGGRSLILDDGTRLSPGHVIVTAGHRSFDLLRPLSVRRLGRGVKGQAALLQPACQIDPSSPIIYFGGVYVIAHDSGRIAVGSTSESDFSSPDSTDHKLDDLISRATELCPALEGSRMVERWAAVRPNAIGRHPMIGRLPEAPHVIACTGGYKISFGIAHKMAGAALRLVGGSTPELPAGFTLEAHYACAD